jgi:hypothetical protein
MRIMAPLDAMRAIRPKTSLLCAAKMTNFFEENRAKWTAAARKAYEYVKGNLPKRSTVRRDEDAKFLTWFSSNKTTARLPWSPIYPFGFAKFAFSQKASVGPAIPAPEISTALPFILL